MLVAVASARIHLEVTLKTYWRISLPQEEQVLSLWERKPVHRKPGRKHLSLGAPSKLSNLAS